MFHSASALLPGLDRLCLHCCSCSSSSSSSFQPGQISLKSQSQKTVHRRAPRRQSCIQRDAWNVCLRLWPVSARVQSSDFALGIMWDAGTPALSPHSCLLITFLLLWNLPPLSHCCSESCLLLLPQGTCLSFQFLKRWHPICGLSSL